MVATVRVTPTATYSRRARDDLDILIPNIHGREVAAVLGTTPSARTALSWGHSRYKTHTEMTLKNEKIPTGPTIIVIIPKDVQM